MNLFLFRTQAVNVLLIFIIAIGLSACKKHNVKPGGDGTSDTNPPLAITSLSVTSGPYNTPVTISGTGFDAVAANDKVYFNGKPATISSATKTTLTAVVPMGAGTGNVSVSVSSVNNGISVNGPVFNYVYTLTVSTVAGNGQQGDTNGPGAQASFNTPWGICTDAAGNLYVADYGNSLIRKIDAAGKVSDFAGARGVTGSKDGQGTAATFYGPYYIKTDASGNFFVTDLGNSLVRKITPQGMVTTFAGNKNGGFSLSPGLDYPRGIAIDASGSVYVAEGSSQIRKITAAGVATVYAGHYYQGTQDGYGPQASFGDLQGLAFDAKGNLYVADEIYSMIRKISPADTVSTFAGTGTNGSANGLGTAASFHGPYGLATDKDGNVYVADVVNNQIRRITPGGTVTTFAGTGVKGSADGPANSATFFGPIDLTVDANGNVYVVDQGNSLIRKISYQ
jgi:sugar lactone lactonase YvrE